MQNIKKKSNAIDKIKSINGSKLLEKEIKLPHATLHKVLKNMNILFVLE